APACGRTGPAPRAPRPAQRGDRPIQCRVGDGRGAPPAQPFTLRVVTGDTNLPPVITSTPPAAGTVGRPYAYDLTGTDPEGDPLYCVLPAAPAGMSLDATRGTLRWTPTAYQIRPAAWAVPVPDGQVATATQTHGVVYRSAE